MCHDDAPRFLTHRDQFLCVQVESMSGGRWSSGCCLARVWNPQVHCPVLSPAHSVSSCPPTYCTLRRIVFCRFHLEDLTRRHETTQDGLFGRCSMSRSNEINFYISSADRHNQRDKKKDIDSLKRSCAFWNCPCSEDGSWCK